MFTRIGDIEYRKTTAPDGHEYEDIICWFPNNYYKAQEKLKNEGWTFDQYGNAKYEHCTINASMFLEKEHCYTIADVEWNSQHDEFDIRSIGTRAFELEGETQENFMKILKIIGASADEQ